MPVTRWFCDDKPPSEFMELLWKARRLARLEVGNGWRRAEAIINAIDDFAEAETGNREYFWNKPHTIGR